MGSPFASVDLNLQTSASVAGREAIGQIQLPAPAALEEPLQFLQAARQTDDKHKVTLQRLGKEGGRAFALKIAHLKDSELRKLATDLPLRTIEAKAPSTTDRYSRAFQKCREWSSPYNEVVCLPTDEISVALYLESLIQGSSPYSSLESACYGINWAHNLYGFQSPCDSKLVKNVLEAAKRSLAKPVSKKEPVTPAMIVDICNRFAGPDANLSDLRLATICVTAYTAFLRYNELASLRCRDVSFSDSFVKIYVYKRKTDVYRDGTYVLLAKTGHVSCPFNLLRRYVSAANLDLSSSLPLFSLFIFS